MNPTEVEKQKGYFSSGETLRPAFRRASLLKLRDQLRARESALLQALQHDLGKPRLEAFTSEFGLVLAELDLALKHLARWSSPRRVRTPWLHWPAQSFRLPLPRGVVLIISPWNYPLQLSLLPLISALAAGNCATVKPSEFAPATAQTLQALIGETFAPEYCRVALADARQSAALVDLPWDHVFFTGSTRVGRLVAQTAAKHLCSMTLELGGKNPCVVLPDADLAIAAERIAWGKFLNAGQTCGAPDHVYVHAAARDAFVAALVSVLQRFYGPDPAASPDYGRIVNPAHFDRLMVLMEHGRIIHGGEHTRAAKYIAPTLMDQVDEASPLMQEEIFGPLLPLLPFSDFRELCDCLQRKPPPLASYLFTRDPKHRKFFLEHVPSGGAAINDTVGQITIPELPLGGLGASGQGTYHGRAGFKAFTHEKSVLQRRFIFNSRMKYPPYRTPLWLLKRIFPWLM